MARSTPSPHPDIVVHAIRRSVAFDDAIGGTALTLEGADTLRCVFRFLEAHAGSAPVTQNAHRSLDDLIEAALVLGWDALSTVEGGARQARDLLQELQAQEPAAVTR